MVFTISILSQQSSNIFNHQSPNAQPNRVMNLHHTTPNMNNLHPPYIICSSENENDDHSESTHSSCFGEDLSHDSTDSPYPRGCILKNTRRILSSQDSEYYITNSIQQKKRPSTTGKSNYLSYITFILLLGICLMLGSFALVLVGFLTLYEFGTKLIGSTSSEER